jgi:hypothetical protein
MGRVSDIFRAVTDTVPDRFSADPAGHPDAGPTPVIDLQDGETLALSAAPVRKRLAGSALRMLAYNGSIPGADAARRPGFRAHRRLHE